MKKALFVFSLVVLISVGCAWAQVREFQAYFGLQYPSELTLSPDAKKVAFSIRQADFDKSQFFRKLWWVETATGHLQQLTFAESNDRAPRFSPDGRWLAFLSNRKYLEKGEEKSGVTQIWLLSTVFGEARRLTSAPEGVQFYRWSPDGNQVAYITRQPEAEAERKKKEELRKHKFDAQVIGEPKQPNEIWSVDVRTGKSRRVATIDPGLDYFAFSPDGKQLVYSTNYTGDFNDAQGYDLFLLTVATGKRRQLTNFPGPETAPLFSPEGKEVAFISQTVPDIEFAQSDVSVIPVSGGPVRNLTRNFDYTVGSFFWGPRGRDIYFEAHVRTATNFFRVRVKTGVVREVLGGTACFSDLKLSRSGKEWAFLKEDAHSLPDVFFQRAGKNFQLTHFSDQLKHQKIAEQKIVRWKSDNWSIEGLVVLPVGVPEGQRAPLILAVHGGPYGRFRNCFRQYYPMQIWARHGYMVLAPNPRGSEGYGDKFGQANRYDLGGGDYRDIMRGVDALVASGLVDSTRMGVIGGSYGGYMTNWIISQTNRFRAAVSMYGIFSLLTDWSNSIQPSWEKMYFGSYYWEKLQPYLSHSPAFFVQNIHTPVLILHGEDDQLTFISNSKEMYQALKMLERPVKFVVYPREGHGISREPNHKVDVFVRATKWFNTYLKK